MKYVFSQSSSRLYFWTCKGKDDYRKAKNISTDLNKKLKVKKQYLQKPFWHCKFSPVGVSALAVCGHLRHRLSSKNTVPTKLLWSLYYCPLSHFRECRQKNKQQISRKDVHQKTWDLHLTSIFVHIKHNLSFCTTRKSCRWQETDGTTAKDCWRL